MTTAPKPQASSFSARFAQFARNTARSTGHPYAFVAAALVIVVWAITGPIFGFSDTWQLVINTGTTIITFLMVFLIQNTQNRDAQAMQVKLDELIRAVEGAHNAMLNLEERDDTELEEARKRYAELGARARAAVQNGELDTRAIELGAEAIQEKAGEIGEQAAQLEQTAKKTKEAVQARKA
jgi:low affinity Fe/Cu permease